jgi:hypothetical protein
MLLWGLHIVTINNIIYAVVNDSVNSVFQWVCLAFIFAKYVADHVANGIVQAVLIFLAKAILTIGNPGKTAYRVSLNIRSDLTRV